MRGKEGVALLSGQIVGITPAYAGKRAAANFHLGTTRDHPRVCGEKAFVRSCCASRTGSPPRMRGKVTHCIRYIFIIWDHPRVCGEKQRKAIEQKRLQGSPPRMRGKVTYDDEHVPGMRITPAYAGKSGHAINPNVCGQDHPRVCGEKPAFPKSAS